jgi:hypothetical protein
MFPNPQDALPLPRQPDLEQYKKRAKELVRAAKSTDPDALRNWSTNWVNDLVERSGIAITPQLPVRTDRWIRDVADFAQAHLSNGSKLCDAQFVIARSHGFPSWPKFIRHLHHAVDAHSLEAQFEAAADAIVTGDVPTLRRLLRATPKLVHLRSGRDHGATLLHYVSANGVEGYRQQTPQNIVAIADLLLRGGADVNASADVYNGNCTALGLVATSIHPQLAGVQPALMQLLLDRGASMETPGLAGHGGSLVRACFANGQPDAAEFLAEHGAPLDLEAAAGVGKLEVMRRFLTADGHLIPPATQRQLQNGFLWASMCGREDVVGFLLERGADLRDAADTGATALHWAAGGGHVELVRLLICRGAPLEVVNRWGGTVLEHAGHGFQHGPANVNFVPTFETLLAAGATIQGSWLHWLEGVNNRSSEEKARVTDVFRRYGATT